MMLGGIYRVRPPRSSSSGHEHQGPLWGVTVHASPLLQGSTVIVAGIRIETPFPM